MKNTNMNKVEMVVSLDKHDLQDMLVELEDEIGAEDLEWSTEGTETLITFQLSNRALRYLDFLRSCTNRFTDNVDKFYVFEAA